MRNEGQQEKTLVQTGRKGWGTIKNLHLWIFKHKKIFYKVGAKQIQIMMIGKCLFVKITQQQQQSLLPQVLGVGYIWIKI